MISREIVSYIEGLTPIRTDVAMEMEQYAKQHQIPIMELIGIETLIHLLKIQQPKRILEIGTAIGYSAIRFAQALPEVQVVSIERDPLRYEKALEYIEKANCSNRIQVLFGDALELVEQVKTLTPFDVLFIDAAKGQYKRFFELYKGFVRGQGLIVSDNVLFRGLVAQEVGEKRVRGIATKLNSYNEWLMQHGEFETTIFPIGDGVAVSIKK